jgi:transcriptional regulator with XRE-family HTH domain
MLCELQDVPGVLVRFVRSHYRTQSEAARRIGCGKSALVETLSGKRKPTKAMLDAAGIFYFRGAYYSWGDVCRVSATARKDA